MIAIYEDSGGEYRSEDYIPTAVYHDGEWIVGGDDWGDFYPPGTPEQVLAEQLTGPSAVAVKVTEGHSALIEEAEQVAEGSAEAGPALGDL